MATGNFPIPIETPPRPPVPIRAQPYYGSDPRERNPMAIFELLAHIVEGEPPRYTRTHAHTHTLIHTHTHIHTTAGSTRSTDFQTSFRILLPCGKRERERERERVSVCVCAIAHSPSHSPSPSLSSLQKDPTARPSLNDLLQHAWIRNASAKPVDMAAWVCSTLSKEALDEVRRERASMQTKMP
jgi:hypothetical protein